jgi:hypothetical protein
VCSATSRAIGSSRRFLLRGLEKVHTEFGIVALAHNLLKVAGIRQLFSGPDPKDIKTGGEKRLIFLHLFYFGDLLDSSFSFFSFSANYASLIKNINVFMQLQRF